MIPGTYAWDVDSNKVVEASEIGLYHNIDLWWQVTDEERNLVPKNGARIAVVPVNHYETVDVQDLLNFSLSDGKISGLNQNIPLKPGTVLALRTAEGNMAKLKVIQYHKLHDFEFDGSEILTPGWKDSVLTRPNLDNYHIELKWTFYWEISGYEEK